MSPSRDFLIQRSLIIRYSRHQQLKGFLFLKTEQQPVLKDQIGEEHNMWQGTRNVILRLHNRTIGDVSDAPDGFPLQWKTHSVYWPAIWFRYDTSMSWNCHFWLGQFGLSQHRIDSESLSHNSLLHWERHTRREVWLYGTIIKIHLLS